MFTRLLPSLSLLSPARGGEAAVAKREDAPANLPTATPLADAWRDDAGVTLVVALPGVAPADVQLAVEGRRLTVTGSQRPLADHGRATLHRGWVPVQWKRTFELADELDTAAISARSEHGLLRVTLPVAAHAAPRRIAVAG